MPTETALYFDNLTKLFNGHAAVSNFTLEIPRGSFYGIVGPNGAGKTTAILMATGLLEPDAGNAFISGHSVWEGSTSESLVLAKQSYGLLADNLDVFNRLSGQEYLNYLGHLRGLAPDVIEERTNGLLEVLGLADADNKYIADYSAGMTKKILLAGAMLHRPKVLILDEPFEAVDPVSAQNIKQILRRYVDSGGTVVMSSHVMELVENLCDHVAIINNGTVCAAGTTAQVADGMSLEERFVSVVGGTALADDSLGWLDND